MYHFQEWLKDILKRHDQINESFIIERIDKKINEISSLPNYKDINIVHEQGTGWHGIDLIVFYLLGKKVYSTDVRDLLKENLLKKTISALFDNIDKYPEYEGKINNLSDYLELSRIDLLEKLNCIFYVDTKFNFELVAENIDLFYSDSVFQRVKVKDVEQYILKSKELLNSKSTSLHYHIIDPKDFLSIQKALSYNQANEIPYLYYLTINKKIWESLTCKYLNYQNRLRCVEFKDIFYKSGFDVDIHDQQIREKDLAYIIRNFNKLKVLKKFQPEEIAISRFILYARVI